MPMSKNVTLPDKYSTLDVNKLVKTDKLELSKLISQTELYTIIKKLKTSKSLGVDDLNPEFYKYYWEDLFFSFSYVVNGSFVTMIVA